MIDKYIFEVHCKLKAIMTRLHSRITFSISLFNILIILRKTPALVYSEDSQWQCLYC